jgi:hypothetical protein
VSSVRSSAFRSRRQGRKGLAQGILATKNRDESTPKAVCIPVNTVHQVEYRKDMRHAPPSSCRRTAVASLRQPESRHHPGHGAQSTAQRLGARYPPGRPCNSSPEELRDPSWLLPGECAVGLCAQETSLNMHVEIQKGSEPAPRRSRRRRSPVIARLLHGSLPVRLCQYLLI